ncbi:hypothetical protein DDP54_01545 [Cellulomonas sp. WB94]|uniref:hypothetical protein n=1 Tax=Cellulomonas sp. WB94 TaxID=2173174 RepID=UPI000D564A7D|nr:hypothetical protein [Cellulomonas sp. WB94]PVU81919.1 hypothetical protein DDP54_01545 [Cellulomonas sp. WB94]
MPLDDGLTQQQGMLLIRESDSAKHLIAYGVQAMRTAALQESTRDPVLTMLSIGVEKVLKLSLGLVHLADSRTWPSKAVFIAHRHNIVDMDRTLREQIRARASLATHRGCVDNFLDAVDHDPIWPEAAAALNAYGQQGRFYWLDALSGSPQPDDTPVGYWENVFNTARDASPELTALFHEAFKSNEAHVEYMLRLNHAAADSIEQWWAMVAMAGMQGVFGERGKSWGLDQHIVPRQVRDTPD